MSWTQIEQTNGMRWNKNTIGHFHVEDLYSSNSTIGAYVSI